MRARSDRTPKQIIEDTDHTLNRGIVGMKTASEFITEIMTKVERITAGIRVQAVEG